MNRVFVYLMALIMVGMVVTSCSLRLREKPEEVEKMPLTDLYNAGVAYYSDGMDNEAKYMYMKIIEKYKKIQNPTEEEKGKYYWALYEIGFINYKNENYRGSVNFMDMVLSGTNDGLDDKSPQIILAKKIKLKITPYLR
jgi:outer membrane protein assembly factor BamD (BamD/ComL family)